MLIPQKGWEQNITSWKGCGAKDAKGHLQICVHGPVTCRVAAAKRLGLRCAAGAENYQWYTHRLGSNPKSKWT